MATEKWYRADYFEDLTEGTEGKTREWSVLEDKGARLRRRPLQKQNASGWAGGVLLKLG